MNKNSFIALALMAIMAIGATFSVGAQSTANRSVLLQHKGSVTQYHPDSIAAAIRNAVEGDTIMLNEGTYPGFTIDKPVTVRGAGNFLTFTGEITVAIPDTPILTQTILEGIYVGGRYTDGYLYRHNLKVTLPTDGLKIKQCAFNSLYFYETQKNVNIDRCSITELWVNSNIESMLVNNTFISQFQSKEDTQKDIIFLNSRIGWYFNWGDRSAYFRGSIINSIILGDSNYRLIDVSLVNSLHTTSIRVLNCFEDNCYSDDKLDYSSDELAEKGYLGNDGTIVGPYGGTTPYTLALDIPTIQSSEILVDNARKVLNVKVTLNQPSEEKK